MIELASVNVRAGSFQLRDVSVTVERGAWWIILGPAGAGKTTLLETIAGVRRIASGTITMRGTDVTAAPPEARKAGMVYQRGHLFPHLTVAENIAYGARDAGLPRELSDRFGVQALEGRGVDALSGGERQVVALVRALATGPDILLLDEPFSALDPRRRTLVRTELRKMQREQRLTVLQVTHDFQETGLLGDAALVLEGGRVAQVGAPSAVFRAPATPSVAEFLGAENIFGGSIVPVEGADADGTRTFSFTGEGLRLVAVGTHGGGQGYAVIRAGDITLHVGDAGGGSARNNIEGTIAEIVDHGVLAQVSIDSAGTRLVATVTANSVSQLGLAVGGNVIASIKATAVHLC